MESIFKVTKKRFDFPRQSDQIFVPLDNLQKHKEREEFPEIFGDISNNSQQVAS